jgi:hypothetical protein
VPAKHVEGGARVRREHWRREYDRQFVPRNSPAPVPLPTVAGREPGLDAGGGVHERRVARSSHWMSPISCALHQVNSKTGD